MSDPALPARRLPPRAVAQRLLAVLVVLALVAYLPALLGDYVFDDIHSVVANPALQAPVDWWRLCWDPSAFSAGSARMFRPVLLLSLAANQALPFGAAALKAGNLLLHVAVTGLLFSWFWRLRLAPRAAFAAAAVFAVHPLLSETINLVSARSELLLLLGVLLALRAQLALLAGAAWLPATAALLVGAVVACGSKETAALLPLLLTGQVLLLRRPGAAAGCRRAMLAILPLLLLVLGYLLLRKLLLGQVTVELLGRSGGDPNSGYGRDLVCQLATMGVLLPRALLQMLLPIDLSLDPPVQFYRNFAQLPVLLGWASVLLLVLLALWPLRRRNGQRRLGLLLAISMALPWIVIPLNMPLAEHRLYGVLPGVLLVVAASLPTLRRPARLPVARLTAVLLMLGAIALSWQRCLDYRDERLLWQHELAARPHSWRAQWGLGTAALRAGDHLVAIEALASANHLYGGHLDVLRNYAEALVRLPLEHRQAARALVVAERFVAAAPTDPWARAVLAEAQFQFARDTGDLAWFLTSEQTALECLQLGPPKALVYRLAAAARAASGDLPGALAHLDQSLARGLDHVSVRLDRAKLLRELGQPQAAQRELLLAQRQAPTDPQVLQALWAAARPGR